MKLYAIFAIKIKLSVSLLINIACPITYKPHFLDLVKIRLGWVIGVHPPSSLRNVDFVGKSSTPGPLTTPFNLIGETEIFHYKADHGNLKSYNPTWFFSLSREFFSPFYLFFHLLLIIFQSFLVYLLYPLLWSEFVISIHPQNRNINHIFYINSN